MNILKSNYIIITFIVLKGFLLSSCQDIITVDLNKATPQVVIESVLDNISDTIKVMVSKTTDYFNPAPNTFINGAEVSISDSSGNIFYLQKNGNSFYYLPNFSGSVGNTYNLTVKIDGIEYKAESKMPVLVKIDSLAYQAKTDERNENAIICYFKDPPGISNYYQIKLYKGDSLLNNNNRIFIYSDKYFDGRFNSFTLDSRRYSESKYKPGDTLSVQLLNIDKQTYEYYNILRNITSEGRLLSATTPANPPNNISNGALGYFAAKSVSEMKIVIKK